MNGNLSELASFHVTGITPAHDLGEARNLNLFPALFAGYQDLSKLRHDYPLVLVEREADGTVVRSLSDIVDGILQEIAPQGASGERLRKHVLKLEEELRGLAFSGIGGTLHQLWERAESNLLARADKAARELLHQSMNQARAALHVDGDVVVCDEASPIRIVTHAWTAVQATKAHATRKRIEHLVLKLSDILRADHMKSEQARSPDTLRSSVGTAFDEAFDFEAMSSLLGQERTAGLLPESRQRRVRAALSVLQKQRFHAPLHEFESEIVREPLYSFVFDSCAAALDAFQSRLPELAEVVKAMSIAELEIQNRYREPIHDPFFAQFKQSALGPDELALFPSYLICLRDGSYDAAEAGRIFEILSSDLPAKILVLRDDILGASSLGTGESLSVGGPRLGTMALGLNNAFVLQGTNASLYRQRRYVEKGLAWDGPALFSVFSGATERVAGVAPYLLAAAATESRAFPVFAYDPAAGPDWASRFSMADNPQANADWAMHRLSYEDHEHQRTAQEMAFTFVDFALCDSRLGMDRVRVERSEWHDDMVPASEHIDAESDGTSEQIPYVLMVDENCLIQRVIVDDKLIRAARRCRAMWRSLQELGGINNSHARRLLEREREAWDQQRRAEPARTETQPAAAPAVAAPAPPAEAAAEPEAEERAEAPSDEPYIETPRCTTCNECTELNGKMFAYNENMQAYIADPDAGPYRHLVEAAESCQVSIIHPGKPRNPDEPNLQELIARAEVFN